MKFKRLRYFWRVARTPNEHFDELRAGDGEEPHARLACQRAPLHVQVAQPKHGEGWDPVVPGDDISGNRTHERAEDHVVVDDLRIDNALADGGRDRQATRNTSISKLMRIARLVHSR